MFFFRGGNKFSRLVGVVEFFQVAVVLEVEDLLHDPLRGVLAVAYDVDILQDLRAGIKQGGHLEGGTEATGDPSTIFRLNL